MHEIITDLEYAITNFKKTPGFDKLITEMAASAEKADGGSFLIQVLKAKGDEFVGNIREFESFYLSGARFEADIALNSGKLMEFKSFAKSTWQNFGDESSLNQLKAYLRSGNKFEYIANKTKLLNDGITDPLKFTKQQFQRVFKNNVEEIFNIIWENQILRERFWPSLPLNLTSQVKFKYKKDFSGIIADVNNQFYSLIKVE